MVSQIPLLAGQHHIVADHPQIITGIPTASARADCQRTASLATATSAGAHGVWHHPESTPRRNRLSTAAISASAEAWPVTSALRSARFTRAFSTPSTLEQRFVYFADTTSDRSCRRAGKRDCRHPLQSPAWQVLSGGRNVAVPLPQPQSETASAVQILGGVFSRHCCSENRRLPPR